MIHLMRVEFIAYKIAAAEYAFMRSLGYSAREAMDHAMWVKADFWRMYRCR